MSAPKHPSTLAPEHYYQGLEERIRSNIIPTLSHYLKDQSTKRILEIASGAGVHSNVYSQLYPHLEIQPTECDDFMTAQCDKTNRDNARVKKAIVLDVTEEEDWKGVEELVEKEGTFDVVLASNCLHMIPFPAGPEAMFAHFGDLVSEDGLFIVYGPFTRKLNEYLSESDEKFDAMIRARENGESLGLRSYVLLDQLARQFGWGLSRVHDVPLGNFILVFARLEEVDASVTTTETESTLEESGSQVA
ncbi:hypothetical protein BCR35DRAFT_353466 [Leucosporidium creatinivorum]|uniref:S-adenosyl-L-methionine-dependent methyltransferase n=1 Tax=Leucosporidium creatinivorum TaxID=106004 RepID=A0A1Y2EWG2_9BASI|nr:hypothetical protein BCR35DRAFT_353466 [Leucosporidium creatinivorum]